MKRKKTKDAFFRIAQKYKLDYQVAHFGARTYPLFYGDRIIFRIGELLDDFSIGKNVLIISHPEIKRLFDKKINASLRENNYLVHWATFSPGEKNKTLKTVEKLYAFCVKKKIDKNSAIIALGGGVIQDVANYLAATYMRGIPFIQIPTTLLAQADLGIGGCALNHKSEKSLIGQFYQPQLAVIDISVLRILPGREIINGISEIINKVVCLGGYDIEIFKNEIKKLASQNKEIQKKYIKLANAAKIRIIEQDETGIKGIRSLLEFGHEIGHALEKHCNYSISHGEAVGIGMFGTAMLSYQSGYLSQKKMLQLRHVIEKSGLPVALPSSIDPSALLKHMDVWRDKNRFILLRDFGSAFADHSISKEQVRNCLQAISNK